MGEAISLSLMHEILIPTSRSMHPMPPGIRKVLLSNLPPPASSPHLIVALLQAAGYQPNLGICSSPTPQGVCILNQSLGNRFGQTDASTILVHLLPPADDPHLRNLPPFLRSPWEGGPTWINVLLINDPLPWEPANYSAPAAPPAQVPSSMAPAATSDPSPHFFAFF